MSAVGKGGFACTVLHVSAPSAPQVSQSPSPPGVCPEQRALIWDTVLLSSTSTTVEAPAYLIEDHVLVQATPQTANSFLFLLFSPSPRITATLLRSPRSAARTPKEKEN